MPIAAAIVLSLSLLSQPASADTGMASYYADRFAGRKTSSGERYDPTRFTAAHRSLPFGTMLLVTRLDSGDTVIVRVNDRGPFHRKRIIDLSRSAAERIGMIRAGVAPVRVEVMESGTAPETAPVVVIRWPKAPGSE